MPGMRPEEGEQRIMENRDAAIPADDLRRPLAVAQGDDRKIPHVGVVGDTNTILLSGKDTAGPPPHRHDFEKTFSLLDGELEFVFRGARMIARAGETVQVRQTHRVNFAMRRPTARMLCISRQGCASGSGQAGGSNGGGGVGAEGGEAGRRG